MEISHKWVNTWAKMLWISVWILSFLFTAQSTVTNLRTDLEIYKEQSERRIALLTTAVQNNREWVESNETSLIRIDKDVYLKLLELSKDITYIRKEIDSKK